MSPLLSAPNRGYADWQRVENWDSGALYSESGVVHTGAWSTPVLDVSRFGFLGGNMQCTGGLAYIASCAWYSDSGATVLVGRRDFIIGLAIGNAAKLRVPNLGPFVQVTFTPIGGNVGVTNLLIGTNRVHPLEVIPQSPILVLQSAITLGSGVNGTWDFTDYISGPIRWWGQSTNSAWTLALQALWSDGVWYTFDQVAFTTTQADGTSVAPPAPCRVLLINGGGATTAWVTVVPSITGGS